METMKETGAPAPGLKHRLEVNGEAAMVVLVGRLESDTAAELVEALEGQARRRSRIALDLAGVTEVDSAGLGALVRGLKAARDAGGDLVLAAPPAPVAGLLDETGLDKVLRVFSEATEARRYLTES